MNKIRHTRFMRCFPQRRIAFGLRHVASVLALGLISMNASAAPPSHWSDGAYAYYAERSTVQKILIDFARTMGMRLEMASTIQGTVNGRIAGNNPIEFLDRLSASHGLTWFVFNGTLYVSRVSDNVTVTISSNGSSITEMRQALIDISLFESRYGWGELSGHNAVIVTGPPAYIELVQRVLEELPVAPQGMEVAVFKLRHASVEDRSYEVRNERITTPGLVTLLRALIGASKGSGGTRIDAISGSGGLSRNAGNLIGSATDSTRAGTGGLFGGLGSVANDSNPSFPEPPQSGSSRSSGGGSSAGGERKSASGASIEGDVRTNSVVVRDVPEMIPVYKRLIQELDQAAPLVEIDAFIIDIDRNKVQDLGVEWVLQNGANYIGQGAAELGDSVGSISLGRKLLPSGSSLVLQNGSAVLARLRLLEQQGDARIVAKPSVLTLDNISALLDLSQTYYVPISGERIAQLNSVTAGVMLKVTPRVLEEEGNRQIYLTVDIEDGSFSDRTGVTLPLVQKSTISTQALVGERQSLMIGGYNRESETDKVDKIPVLGDMPFVGALFRHKGTERNVRERLFILSPRVVDINRVAEKNAAVRSRLEFRGIDPDRVEMRTERQMPPLPPKNDQRNNPNNSRLAPVSEARPEEPVTAPVARSSDLALPPPARTRELPAAPAGAQQTPSSRTYSSSASDDSRASPSQSGPYQVWSAPRPSSNQSSGKNESARSTKSLF